MLGRNNAKHAISALHRTTGERWASWGSLFDGKISGSEYLQAWNVRVVTKEDGGAPRTPTETWVRRQVHATAHNPAPRLFVRPVRHWWVIPGPRGGSNEGSGDVQEASGAIRRERINFLGISFKQLHGQLLGVANGLWYKKY